MSGACDHCNPEESSVYNTSNGKQEQWYRKDRVRYPSIKDDKRAIHFIEWTSTKSPSEEAREYVLKYISMDTSDYLFFQEVERINKLSLEQRIKMNRLYTDVSSYIKIRLPYFYASPFTPPATPRVRASGDDGNNPMTRDAILLSLGIRGCRGDDGNIVYSNNNKTNTGFTGQTIVPDVLKECPPRTG